MSQEQAETPTAFDTTPTESTQRTVHLPRLFVHEACIERDCGTLRGEIGAALLNSAQNPDFQSQYDIVCKGKKLGICAAQSITTGHYATFGSKVPDSDELFLQDPVILEGQSNLRTIDVVVREAIENGASERTIDELPRR